MTTLKTTFRVALLLLAMLGLGLSAIGLTPPSAIRNNALADANEVTSEAEAIPPLTNALAQQRLAGLLVEVQAIVDPELQLGPAPEGLLDDLELRLLELLERTEHPELRASGWRALGVLRHHRGAHSDAAESFRQSDLDSQSPFTRADARFWLGHTLYAAAIAPSPAAESLTEADSPPSPIDELKALVAKLRPAAAAFRTVLDEDPTRTDAAQNCEKIRKQIAEALQQIQDLEDLLEQLREQAEQMQDLAEEQQDASEDSAESDQSRREELEQQQQDLNQRTEQSQQQTADMQQQAQQAGQQQLAQQIQQSQEQLNQAREAQDRAQELLQQGDLEQASAAQEEAAEALRQAAENLQQTQEQNQGSSESESEDTPNPDEHNQDTGSQEQQAQQGEEPGDQLVQDLLDREQQQREERELRNSRLARPTRVERDW